MEKIKQFIQDKYDNDNYIFPSAIAYNLKIEIEYVRECLEQLVTEGMLQRIYAVSHGCGHSEDIINRYTSIDDIDDYAYCDVCMCEYNPKTHIEIEYKLIR